MNTQLATTQEDMLNIKKNPRSPITRIPGQIIVSMLVPERCHLNSSIERDVILYGSTQIKSWHLKIYVTYHVQ